MRRSTTIRVLLIGLLSAVLSSAGSAQTAQGTINATLVNGAGIAILFNSDSSGVALAGSGTAAATLNMGTVSAYGVLSGGVMRSNVTGSSFTVSTPFDVEVVGGVISASYTLTAQLAAAAPTGFSYLLDAVPLTTTAQTITSTGTYNTSLQHNIGIVISTASPASGGPAVGTQLTSTINFVATAN